MLRKIAPYWKAAAGFVTPGAVALVAAVQDKSPGGSAITGPEWVGIVAACVITGGAVYAAPRNADRQPATTADTAPPAA